MNLKYVSAVFSLITALTIAPLYTTAAAANTSNNAEKEVRIGLVYSKKPSDIIDVNGDKGLTLGQALNKGEFNQVFDNADIRTVSVMKDVYYEKKDNKIKFILNNGVVSDNWHIKIGDAIASYSEGIKLKDTYKSRGLDTFLYYNYDGMWQILTGECDSAEAADYYMKDLEKGYADLTFDSIKPGEKSLMIMDSNKNILMVFNPGDGEMVIAPKNDGLLKLNSNSNKIYRGRFSIYRVKGGGLTLVNALPIEQYLYGVVPSEIGGNSPLEACKAQAVAARNYTYNSLGKHSTEGFDLCDTTECQVYGGKNSECATSNKAVDETKGKLLKYNGRTASLFYFSSTGGVDTEDVENVWGSQVPYLKSVDSKYESGKTYHAIWNTKLTKDEISKFLSNKKVDIGEVLDVTVTKRSKVGRAIEVKVTGAKGEKLFTKESARTVFKLDSQYYNITTDADVFVIGADGTIKRTVLAGKKVLTDKGIETVGTTQKNLYLQGITGVVKKNIKPEEYFFAGKGWGHAVGLSQDGAIGMAKAGFTYDQILTHYFPGTMIE